MIRHSMFIHMLFAAVGILTACSEEEASTPQQREIVFECLGGWQESRTIGGNAFCDDVSISASYFTTTWDAASCTPNYMHQQKAILSGSNYAFDGGARWYWPNSGKLRFFAYGPYDAVSGSMSTASATGAPTVEFTCPVPTSGQYDLQYAQSIDYECATGGSVSLPFNHTLAAVAVTMNPSVGVVEGATLHNIASTATYTPGSGWSNQTNTTDFSWSNPSDGSGLFVALIPQDLSGTAAQLTVTFTLSSDNARHSMTYDLASNNIAWEPATLYHYEVKVESGTFIPTTPEPTTDLIIGVAGWEMGGFDIIAGSEVYDLEGNLTDEVHNFVYTLPASYTPGDNPGQSSINFVYTEGTHITGYPSTPDNEMDGTAENGDGNNDINDFDDTGEGHDGNSKNEGDPETTDGTTIIPADGEYDPNITDDNPYIGDQSGYDNSTITGYPDNPDNETDGTAENGDENTGINGFDDTGEGNIGNGKNEGGEEYDNNNKNSVENDTDDRVNDDYTEGDNTNGDGNTSDEADQSEQSTYGSGDVTGYTDGEQSVDGTAENGDNDTGIDSFEQGDNDLSGYAHADTDSSEGGNNGEDGQNRSEPTAPSPAPSSNSTRGSGNESGNNSGDDNESK